jgi:hypothetical protein
VLLNLVSFDAGHASMARHLSGFVPSDSTVYPSSWFDYHAQTLDRTLSRDEGPFPCRNPYRLSPALRSASCVCFSLPVKPHPYSPALGGYLQSLTARSGHGKGPLLEYLPRLNLTIGPRERASKRLGRCHRFIRPRVALVGWVMGCLISRDSRDHSGSMGCGFDLGKVRDCIASGSLILGETFAVAFTRRHQPL